MKIAEYHSPVLFEESLRALLWNPNGVYADCTLGGGGHSEGILKRLEPAGHLHSFDRDPEAIAYARKRLAPFADRVTFHPVPFGRLADEVCANSLSGVLYDLGISSHQVDDDSRGFTFQGTNPVDLRMDSRAAFSAQDWMRTNSLDEMARAFKENADLDRAYKLSQNVQNVVSALSTPILPEHLKLAAEKTYPDRIRDINSILARIFQAIRMEVNGELDEIRTSMRAAVEALVKGGRLVVISYHSVEDRTVKLVCAEFEKNCICPPQSPVCLCGDNHQKLKKVFRKPILPTGEEIAKNPRARSAKLRVYEKV
ncbi:MAG: 16S rRNA (cytosine(1402)-N(4))-methyltransferase RsmH [Fibrobacter intestinalis]|uniref:Ribosomal RNA small subunit methyltransferase H n=1 Tax=Fibrobacter intestinalis TaxID=28122 RepID=A0A1T4QLE3_9BACT|nr:MULTISPECIES: 16S rRNA (cytosine(1402)-N(4))-methyltransferase RsmH [Fibrobacter]PBC66834.1 16S rRNA (cytosine1402-N4)-methyltransferase [Fibrobacter sp. UWS1]PBC75231.1 16S rRNA (cytosine1402-N4)-methyltransferase [Fibrobacter sp. NR9]SKA04088.1 16S rRNA (cytosine1402-N4)-methyltransferase [Fibrobacter intestinalis]